MLAMGATADHVKAGGGPENVFVVVNTESSDSLTAANAFIALRRVPPNNVLAMAWDGPNDAVPIRVFRERILRPILTTIDARGLAPQIDCIAYSCGFPWRVDFSDDLLESHAGLDKHPAGSLTGMTFLYAATLEPPVGGIPPWLSRHANRYAPPASADDAIVPRTRGFRAARGWGSDGEPITSGGSHHVLAVMLGVTGGRGNSIDEIVTSLEAATAVDGKRPAGTIYFLENRDIRTTTRSAGFRPAATAIRAAGGRAEIVMGTLPHEKPDVAGLMTGTAEFDWVSSGSTLVPGAICDNLTSFGGVLSPGASQTPFSEFIRAGAAGSSGTVIEPYALAEKFPAPSLHVHYVRGACLAEAFYRSLRSPYQLLVVGDPLCQPWAKIPSVDVAVTANTPAAEPVDVAMPLAGTITLAPRGTPKGFSPIGCYELFVDGLRIASCREGDRLPLDTTLFSDGHHEVRVVAVESSPIETQGRWVKDVAFANHGHHLTLSAEPRRLSMADALHITVSGSRADSVTVFSAGRVLGRLNADDRALDVPAADLGCGTVTLYAIAHRDGVGVASATPVTIVVQKTIHHDHTGGR